MIKTGMNFNRDKVGLPLYKRTIPKDIRISIINCKDLLRLLELKERELLFHSTKRFRGVA